MNFIEILLEEGLHQNVGNGLGQRKIDFAVNFLKLFFERKAPDAQKRAYLPADNDELRLFSLFLALAD
jgi:hypothetical protein